MYRQFVKLRGIDAGHEILQIFAETSENEGGESGDGRTLFWSATLDRGKEMVEMA